MMIRGLGVTIVGLILTYFLFPIIMGVGLYVYVFWFLLAPSYQGPIRTQDERGEMLLQKIVTCVEAHPELGVMSLQDLRDHDGLSSEDMEDLRALKYQYHPISAASPDRAFVLDDPPSTRKNRSTVFHKGYGAKRWHRSWSDEVDREFAFRYPGNDSEGLPQLRSLTHRRSEKVVFEYLSDCRTTTAWNHSGTVLVIREVTKDGRFDDFVIVVPNLHGIVSYRIDSIDITKLLAEEFRNKGRAFEKQWVDGFMWKVNTNDQPERLWLDWRGEWSCHDPAHVDGTTKFHGAIELTFDNEGHPEFHDFKIEAIKPEKKIDKKIRQMSRIEREEFRRRNLTPAQRSQLLQLQKALVEKHPDPFGRHARRQVDAFIERCNKENARADAAIEKVEILKQVR